MVLVVALTQSAFDSSVTLTQRLLLLTAFDSSVVTFTQTFTSSTHSL
jgi:hypothetical protein